MTMALIEAVVLFSFWIITLANDVEIPNQIENVHQCIDTTTCAERNIVCEDTGDCTVNCHKAFSCSDTTVICPRNAYCTVNCGEEESSCASINITATQSAGLTVNVADFANSMQGSNIYVVSQGRHHPSVINCAIGNNSPCKEMNIHSQYGFADVELLCGKQDCFTSSVMHCGTKDTTTCVISRTGITAEDEWTCIDKDNKCSTINTPNPTVSPTNPTFIPSQSPSTVPSVNPTMIPTTNPTTKDPTTNNPTTYAPTSLPTVITHDGEVVTTALGDSSGAKNEIDASESNYNLLLYGGIVCAVLLFCCVLILIGICLFYKKKRKEKENKNKIIQSTELKENNIKIKVATTAGASLPFHKISSHSTPGDIIDDENMDILLNKNSIHQSNPNEGNENDHSDSEQLYDSDKDKEEDHLNEQQQAMDGEFGDPSVTGFTTNGNVSTPMTPTGGNTNDAFKTKPCLDNDKNDDNNHVNDPENEISIDDD